MNEFIRTLKGEKVEAPPVWLMRQAGRYLPEYMELRKTVSGFMEAVLTPAHATEITLQPLRRFPQLDAAILFSDILVIPYALGQDVQFVKGEGPQLPALDTNNIDLTYDPEKLSPVIQTVKNIRAALPKEKTVIGFAGAPWTVACYMIAGSNYDEFSVAKKWAFRQPEKLDALLDTVTNATIEYLLAQIAAGANVVQIFESWAGLLTGHKDEFERFIIKPTLKIVNAIRDQYPNFPIIGFPRNSGTYLPWFVERTKVTAVGLDWSVDLKWVNETLPKNFPVQGNLDPIVLLTGGEILQRKAREIIDIFSDRPLIFNLGHGVIKETPPEHVAQLLNAVKN
jgi:uroporphyrinogen decarboxylase